MPELAPADIERLLRASRDEIDYPTTPDIARHVLDRLHPAPPDRGHLVGLIATAPPPRPTPREATPPIAPGTGHAGLTRQFVKLAAAILAFVAVGGLLVAVFQLTGNGDDDQQGAPATGTTTQDRLYVLSNIPDRGGEQARSRFIAYDAETHEEVYSLDVSYASEVAMSPDGSVAYLMKDGLVAVRTSDGSLIWRAPGVGSVGYISGGPPSLSLSADGTRLFVYTSRVGDDGTFLGYTLRAIDVATGAAIADVDAPANNGCAPQLHASQSNHRVYLTCWTGSRIRIIDLGMERFTYDISIPSRDGIAGAAQSPDGLYLYVVSAGPQVDVVNTYTGKLEATHDLATAEPLAVQRGLLALSEDGTRLAIGIQTVSHYNGLHDVGRIIVVDTATWQTVADLNLDPALHDPPMTGQSMTFSPDGSALYISATEYEAGTVNVVESSFVVRVEIATGAREVVVEADGDSEQVWRVFSGRVGQSQLPELAGQDDSWPPMLLLDLNPTVKGPDKLQIRPVDPDTLDDVDGLRPIAVGQHWDHALSPDGRTLAAFTWPTQESVWGALRLLDLETWQTTIAPVTNIGRVSDLSFTDDGQSLYWVAGDYVEGEFVLWRYDLATERASIVTAFPRQFVPWELRMLSDNRLAVYGVPTDVGNLNAGDPRVIVVDFDDGGIVADVVLGGIKSGQYHENPTRWYHPGLAWDIERKVLYIVHPDENVITLVDLERGVIAETTAYAPRKSRTDRLFDWLAPTAAASPVPWTSRQVVLSDDGRTLFIAPGTSWNNWWQEDLDRFPLQVIETSNLSESREVDLPSINNMMLSPDGRLLILQTFDYDTAEDGQRVQTNQQMLGLTIDGLRQIGSINLEGIVHESSPTTEYAISGFSDDGRWLYFIQRASADDAQSIELRVLDLDRWTVTATRTLDNTWYGELVVPQ